MTDQPFVGHVYLEVGDESGSPLGYTRMCEITGMTGIGETNSLVDVTTFCSGGNKEYIGGLADGTEITLSGNLVVDSEPRRRMIRAVKQKQVVPLRIVADDDQDGVTDITFWFSAVALSWKLNPSIDKQNGIDFGLKISGAIDITEP